jgi:hypothetical protein
VPGPHEEIDQNCEEICQDPLMRWLGYGGYVELPADRLVAVAVLRHLEDVAPGDLRRRHVAHIISPRRSMGQLPAGNLRSTHQRRINAERGRTLNVGGRSAPDGAGTLPPDWDGLTAASLRTLGGRGACHGADQTVIALADCGGGRVAVRLGPVNAEQRGSRPRHAHAQRLPRGERSDGRAAL